MKRPKLKATLTSELKVISANLLFLEILYNFSTRELEKFRIRSKFRSPILSEESRTIAISKLLGQATKNKNVVIYFAQRI